MNSKKGKAVAPSINPERPENQPTPTANGNPVNKNEMISGNNLSAKEQSGNLVLKGIESGNKGGGTGLAPPPKILSSGRLGSRYLNQIRSLVGRPKERRLSRGSLLIPEIRHYEQEFGRLTARELLQKTNQLRGLVRSGSKDRSLVAQAFGLCSVAIYRHLGMRAFDVQLAAGVVMHEGALVELATGEGKTLTAAFPVFLNALANKGVHVTTVNDYLAKRDAETLGPVYRSLGLEVGVLQMKMEDHQRTIAYKADITYGTASEFGFDFLRDRLKLRSGQTNQKPFWTAWTREEGEKKDPRVQRELYYAVVDEADSIFVDEAKTPLIISAPTRKASPEESIVYLWADQVARTMKPREHFIIDYKKDKIDLTEEGRRAVRYSNPPTGPHSKAMDKLFEAIEKAVHAHFRFILDHHYMVHDEKVIIIDEGTGRPMPDRHWREGLHQAVEAKEKVPIHLAADHAAQITFQNYFRLYRKKSGMSGTLRQNSIEMRKVYQLHVIQVPTNRPVIRQEYPDQVFLTEEEKFNAVVEEIAQMKSRGRPVLIGTRTVEKSELLSEKLRLAGIDHRVLNAKHNQEEALVVAEAGRPGAVTVATNMAGRGTDIKLGGALDELERPIRDDSNLSDDEKQQKIQILRDEWQKIHDQVVNSGGLHVIGTEHHDALRIDRQLMGRAGRQGDPGSAQFFVSLEDQILEVLPIRIKKQLAELIKKTLEKSDGGKIDHSEIQTYRRYFQLAQRITERKHLRQRLDLMNYDKQRKELLSDLGADPFVD